MKKGPYGFIESGEEKVDPRNRAFPGPNPGLLISFKVFQGHRLESLPSPLLKRAFPPLISLGQVVGALSKNDQSKGAFPSTLQSTHVLLQAKSGAGSN